MSESDRLEADGSEGERFDRIAWVCANNLSEIFTSLACETVSFELQLGNIMTVLFFEDRHQVQSS